MSIILKYGELELPLDPDLFWVDENESSAVKQAKDRGLTGALIIQVDGDASSPGRPITLQPEDDLSAWMIQQDLATLNVWGAIPGAEFELTLRGITYPVMFRHDEPPAISAKPVVHFSDVKPTDYYLVTLKFMTI